MAAEIPDVVIDRLPVYARALALLDDQGREVVNSQELGKRLGVTPAQIRKDLSYFGRFGKQGRGYNVARLLAELREILGLTRDWSMVLVGVGQLGHAIVSYAGFKPQGFHIVEIFDADPSIVGTTIDGLTIRHVDTLPDVLRGRAVDIGIVAVPGSAAQGVVDVLVQAGLKAILNYAPIAAQVPSDVRVKDIDPVLALQSMTFHVKSLSPSAK